MLVIAVGRKGGEYGLGVDGDGSVVEQGQWKIGGGEV